MVKAGDLYAFTYKNIPRQCANSPSGLVSIRIINDIRPANLILLAFLYFYLLSFSSFVNRNDSNMWRSGVCSL